MASSSLSKLENNDGNEAPQWTSQCITCDEIDGVPLNVLTNRRVLDHAFSEQQSGVEVDPASVDPHAAASVDPVMLTQPPPSPPPVVESVTTEIGYSEAMTSVRPLGTQHYYIPDPPAHLIPPPPPPLHSSPSLPPRPPSQPITYSQSIQQSTMMSFTPPSFSQPQFQTTSMSLPNQTLTSPLDQTILQSPPPPPPSQSKTTTTSLPPPSLTPLPSPQTLTSSSHQTMPSPSPSPPPPPSSDQNHAIASPLQQSDQTTTSTPLPPPPSSQSAKPKVISPLSLGPSEPLLVTTRIISPPPLASHPTTTPTTGAQPSPSAAESTREMSAKRKRGRPRKEFAGERSESGVEGRVEEASQEKKKHIQGEGEGEDKGRQPAPSFASPSSTSASPSVLFNHPNSTVLGFSSCRNVIQPASIIASQNEDISAKIISFALNNGAVFVLAASGQLSSLRYMEPSGVVQETTGVYEILSLSGTLLLSNEGEAPTRRSRTGYLTISVVGMDGKIIGGRVCGSMIAASPVQVVGGAIVAASSDDKDSASSKHPSSDQSEALLLELNKKINSLSQEWQAQLLDTKKKVNERVESIEKELRQAKQELEETRQLLNQTRQELQETRLSVNTTQNLLMQLFEQLNIVNPPPPPHSSTSNPPSL